ncbi:prepilin-type N-terminal cleavage/methylation domain-containing protein [Desulfosporosinus burensis]
MIKRRKDEGFTLIELMIVIAVIGILAVVLVPKVGTVKTQAKATGLDTNIRLVEGYVQSKITKWADKSVSAAAIQSDILAAFDLNSSSEKISNPFTLSTTIDDAAGNNALTVLIQDADATTNKGAVVVSIDVDPSYAITITGHDNNTGATITEKTVTITP